MVYLIGLHHVLQRRNPYYKPEVLKAIGDSISRMKETIEAHDIKPLAEELSLEACRVKRTDELVSMAEKVAEQSNIKHLFCDPDSAERYARRIPVNYGAGGNAEFREIHKPREEFWAEKLEPYKSSGILFLCGDNHKYTFRDVLYEKGFEATVVGFGFGCQLPGRADYDFYTDEINEPEERLRKAEFWRYKVEKQTMKSNSRLTLVLPNEPSYDRMTPKEAVESIETYRGTHEEGNLDGMVSLRWMNRVVWIAEYATDDKETGKSLIRPEYRPECLLDFLVHLQKNGVAEVFVEKRFHSDE